MTTQPQTPAGVLLVDKPTGPTSMAVCARVRWLLRQGGAPKRIKVGHAGTLDPMATGLLVVMVGSATRLCDTLMQGEKEYLATIDLAHRSTTDDAEGQLTIVPVAHAPTREAIVAALAGLTGTIQQTPPAFSAIKLAGARAYDLARAGKPTPLTPRPVTVHAIEVLEYAFPNLRVRVACGKGTYIRALARDLGTALATGGMLTALRRTRVGQFRIEDALPMSSLPQPLLASHLAPVPPRSP